MLAANYTRLNTKSTDRALQTQAGGLIQREERREQMCQLHGDPVFPKEPQNADKRQNGRHQYNERVLEHQTSSVILKIKTFHDGAPSLKFLVPEGGSALGNFQVRKPWTSQRVRREREE